MCEREPNCHYNITRRDGVGLFIAGLCVRDAVTLVNSEEPSIVFVIDAISASLYRCRF